MPNKLSQFWQELKRRKVIKVIAMYAGAAFVLIELTNNIVEPLRLPEWTPTLVILLLVIGFPITLILSWIFDVTPEGIRKTEPIEANTEGNDLHSTKDKPVFSEKSIIVLPFENISPDPDQEYFSDGLTEEIITDLSHIHDMLVISRSSAMTFKGTKKKIKEIAGDVNVRYVLEGSVRKAENNLRITAQLIDARNDSHIWAEKYNGTLDDVFDIQEKVSKSIATSLKIKLSKDLQHQISQQSISDPFVYDLYLKARYENWQFNEVSFAKSEDLLNQGLKLSGDNELLLSELCHVNVQYVNNLMKDPNDYPKILSKANQYAERAIQKNPYSASSYYAQGIAAMQSCQPKETINSFKKAIAIEPNHSEPMLYVLLGYMYSAAGLDLIEAEKLMEKAKNMDPLTPIVKTCQGWRLFFQGEFQESVEELAEWQNSLEQINSPFMMWGAWIQGLNQNYKEAFRIIDQLISNKPEHFSSSFGQFIKFSWLKEKDKALDTVTDVLEKAVWWDDLWSLIMAEGYAVIEEYDKAFHFLDRATNYGIANIAFLTEYDPFLENLRGEERFKKLMERVKYEWENFEV
jgi:TolB-like protein